MSVSERVSIDSDELSSFFAKCAREYQRGYGRESSGDTGGFDEGVGEFLKAIQSSRRGVGDDRLKALTVASDPGGGYLVPSMFREEILREAFDSSPLLGAITKMPITEGNTLRVPAIDGQDHSVGAHGVSFSWTAEGATITEVDPKFRTINLAVNKLAGLTYITNELLSDNAVALETVLPGILGEAFRFELEGRVVNGSGAGQPLGILNASATVSVAKETGQAATTIVTENIVNMWSRMWTRGHRNAIWLVSPNALPQILTMSLAVGTGGAPMMLVNTSGPAPMSMFGRPIVICEHCATLGTVGDVIFVDPSAYIFASKGEMMIDISEHAAFATDRSALRIKQRLDGQPWLNEAITPANSGATLSPFVTLATRS